MTTDEALIITDVLCVRTASYFLSPVYIYIYQVCFLLSSQPSYLAFSNDIIYLPRNMPLFLENSGLAQAGFTKLIRLRFGNEMPRQE